MNKAKFYIKKISGLLITIFLVTLITFFTFNILPGNPALAILGPDADMAQIQALEAEFHLDQPLYARYLSWIAGLFRGDLGYSYRYGQKVVTIISKAFGVTFSLGLFSLVLTVLIGLPLGILMGQFSKKKSVKVLEVFDQIWLSTPGFCTAILLIMIFTVILKLFPSMGYVPFFKDPVQSIRTMFLPALSLSVGSSAILARYLKTDFTMQKSLDYVRTARSKGLSTGRIVFVHILRNSLICVVTTLGLIVTDILGGSIIIENVFSLPGIGRLIATSITSRDFPLIQGLVLYLAVITVTVNFIVDVLYHVIDPRTREVRK
ncbi:MAG: ABC transporter permease [Treponema sp.]|nr:ABC transporter permease [Treponema sp.]